MDGGIRRDLLELITLFVLRPITHLSLLLFIILAVIYVLFVVTATAFMFFVSYAVNVALAGSIVFAFVSFFIWYKSHHDGEYYVENGDEWIAVTESSLYLAFLVFMIVFSFSLRLLLVYVILLAVFGFGVYLHKRRLGNIDRRAIFQEHIDRIRRGKESDEQKKSRENAEAYQKEVQELYKKYPPEKAEKLLKKKQKKWAKKF